MKKNIVAVDMDDTICHLVPRCIAWHNTTYPNHPLRYEDCVRFKLEGIWHPDCTQEKFFGQPGLYRNLDLIDEHVLEEMEKLHDRHDLIIITAAYPTAVLDKWEWLQEHMPFIPVENFFPIKRKARVDFDILIDDGGHNLLAATQAGKNVLGIPRPWNADVRREFLFRENDSWQGMADYIDTLLEVNEREKASREGSGTSLHDRTA